MDRDKERRKVLELSCFLRGCVVRCLLACRESACLEWVDSREHPLHLSFSCDVVGRFEYSHGSEDIYTVHGYESRRHTAKFNQSESKLGEGCLRCRENWKRISRREYSLYQALNICIFRSWEIIPGKSYETSSSLETTQSSSSGSAPYKTNVQVSPNLRASWS